MFVEPAYGRLCITYLADQDDIGILPDRRVNSCCEAVNWVLVAMAATYKPSAIVEALGPSPEPD